MQSVKVRVPGTTANCGPGFDSLGIACTIYNTLELSLLPNSQIIIEVSGEGASSIPKDERNIAYQAVKKVFERLNKNNVGVCLRMNNDIPLARGLGSSAAAIVSGLTAANLITGETLTKQDILEMATDIEGHPDNVAPAILGGASVSVTGTSGVHTLRIVPKSKLYMVVVVPDFGLSTKAARQVLPKYIPFKDAVFNISRASLFVGALLTGDYQMLPFALDDRLHQPYREKLIPGMQAVFSAAIHSGALGAAISGAGSCLIAFTEKNTNQIGQAMLDAFSLSGVKARYLTLDIDLEGAKLIE